MGWGFDFRGLSDWSGFSFGFKVVRQEVVISFFGFSWCSVSLFEFEVRFRKGGCEVLKRIIVELFR